MVNVKELREKREKEAMAEEFMLSAEQKNKDLSEMRAPTPTPQKDNLKREEHLKDVKEGRGQGGNRREERQKLISSEQNRAKTPEVMLREETIQDSDEERRRDVTPSVRQLIHDNRVKTEELLTAEQTIKELRDGMKTTEDSVVKMKRTLADLEGERREEVRQQGMSDQLLSLAEQQNEELKSQMKASEHNMLKMKAELQDMKEEQRENGKLWEGIMNEIVTEHKDYIDKLRTAETKAQRMEQEMSTMANVRELMREKEALKEQLRCAEQQNQEMKIKIKTTESNVVRMEEMIKVLKEERREERRRWDEQLQQIREEHINYVNKMRSTESKVMRIEEEMSTMVNAKKMLRIKDETKTPEDNVLNKAEPMFNDIREERQREEGRNLEERFQRISTENNRDMNQMQTTENKVQKIKALFSQMKADVTEVVKERRDEGKQWEEEDQQRLEQIPEEDRFHTLGKEMTQINTVKQRNRIKEDLLREQLRDAQQENADMKIKMNVAENNVLLMESQIKGLKELIKTESKVQRQEQMSPMMVEVTQLLRKKKALRKQSPEPKSPEFKYDKKTPTDYNVPKIQEQLKDIREPIKTTEGSKFQQSEEVTPIVDVKRLIRKKEEAWTERFSSPVSKSPEIKRDYNVLRTEGKKEEPIKTTESKEEAMTPKVSVKQIIRRKPFRGQSPYPQPKSPEIKKIDYNVLGREGKKEEPFKTTESRTQESKSEDEISMFNVKQLFKKKEPKIENLRKVEEKMNKEPFRTTERKEEMTPTFSVKQLIRKKEGLTESSLNEHYEEIKDIKEEPVKTTEVSSKDPKAEEEIFRGRRIRKKDQLPSPEQPVSSEMQEEMTLPVSVKQMIRTRRPLPSPEVKIKEGPIKTENRVQGSEDTTQMAKVKQLDTNKKMVVKAEEETTPFRVKRLTRKKEASTEQQEELREGGRTSKDERPYPIPAEQKTKTTDYRDSETMLNMNQLIREKEAIAAHMLSSEQKSKAMRNELKALEDNKRREETLQFTAAERDPQMEETTTKQLIKEKEAITAQLQTAEQKNKHMKDEMTTMAHNVLKMEEKIKNMEEEQRGEEETKSQEDKSLQPISTQQETQQLTAGHDEDINMQTVEDIHLENMMLHFRQLTLDANTASSKLSLSENNRRVTNVKDKQSHPYHQDRFDYWSQVMCTEGLTGRCYWEVEWTVKVSIAVSYKGISRRGTSDIGLLGFNDKSWSLDCNAGQKNLQDNSYTVRHNKVKYELPASPSGSNRVGVYLDWDAGKLSFYCISSDTRIHLYTYQCAFTEPLHCAFWCWTVDSSVSLCQKGDIQ